ncbi:hypothetical protein L3X07_01440 [Levilactobacillus brevis]|nr:hypothetical protein [Levilactobacillus brevis]
MLAFGRRLAPQSPLITIAGRQGEGQQRQYFSQTVMGPVDDQQVQMESLWLGQTVRQVCQSRRWDATRLITVGYSNGAAMAAYGLQSGHLLEKQLCYFDLCG